MRGDTGPTARAVDWKQSATDFRRVLRGVTGGTARAADWEQSATDLRSVLRGGCTDIRRVLRGSTTRELRDNAAAEQGETNEGHLGINTDKRICKQRYLTTMSLLGGMINAAIEPGVQSVDVELDSEAYTPLGYKDAARSRKWRESMRTERGALDKRECWDVARIPSGVTLIRSRYVYKLKKDWT